ncbi:MAG: hypothetical protein IKL62_05650 [Clostridia bacterium]|nr:hypothetical protein [Clostridia bacterium]
MQLYSIKNEFFTVTASSYGAHLQSMLSSDGIEVIFQGDDKWKGKSPNIFPIIGTFDSRKYTFEGREYPYPCHGVAPTNEYEVSIHTETELEFKLTDNEETRKIYPFSFEFYINYKLEGDKLIYTARAVNTDTRPMYCETGTHTGFSVARSFKGAKLVFDSPEKDYTVKNNDPKKCGARFIDENGELPLSDWLFETGAVTIGNINSGSVTLEREDSNYSVVVGLGNYPVLSLWSVPEASYVCIEPWSCESSHYAKTEELTEQIGIDIVAPGEAMSYYNTISIKRK